MSEGKVRFGANDRKSANAQTTVKKIESYKNPNLLPPEVQKGRVIIFLFLFLFLFFFLYLKIISSN